MAPSEIMRRIKGRSSSKIFESYPDLRKNTGVVTSGQEAYSHDLRRFSRKMI